MANSAQRRPTTTNNDYSLLREIKRTEHPRETVKKARRNKEANANVEKLNSDNHVACQEWKVEGTWEIHPLFFDKEPVDKKLGGYLDLPMASPDSPRPLKPSRRPSKQHLET